MVDWIDDNTFWNKLDETRLLNSDRRGNPISSVDEAMAITFHRIDNSLDMRELLLLMVFCDSDEVPSERLSSCIPSN